MKLLTEVRGREALARRVGFGFLGETLGRDLRASIASALKHGTRVGPSSAPLQVFRDGLAQTLAAIETDPRGVLFQRFLAEGPYDGEGDVPPEAAGKYLSDDETAEVIRFVFFRMVNGFQGFLAECLSLAPIARLIAELAASGRLLTSARLFFGDTARSLTSNGVPAKGADGHVLSIPLRGPVVVHGLVEVKSYHPSPAKLRRQLARHLERARCGLLIEGTLRDAVTVSHPCHRIVVAPSTWRLSRAIVFDRTAGGRRLVHHEAVPPVKDDTVEWESPGFARITLRWSRESLAAAAYEMTFWYMAQVGESVFRRCPSPWPHMTPAEAGRNAAKQALYYAIMRGRTRHEWERAVALYNSYGFGYALGANFRDKKGVRQMLWPEDLDAIIAHGHNKDGWAIT